MSASFVHGSRHFTSLHSTPLQSLLLPLPISKILKLSGHFRLFRALAILVDGRKHARSFRGASGTRTRRCMCSAESVIDAVLERLRSSGGTDGFLDFELKE